MSALRATLRIARRDALRSRGRSVLVVAMIALPVLGVTAVDVVLRTYQLSPEQEAERSVGAADAAFSDSGLRSIEQTAGPGYTSEDGVTRESPVDLLSVLPPGSRSVPDVSADRRVEAGGATTSVTVRALDHTDPLAEGLYRQAAGRPAAGPDEVVVTAALAERLSLEIGDELTLAGESSGRIVVGEVADQSSRASLTVLLPSGQAPGDLSTGAPRRRLLVDVPDQLAWSAVEAANAVGVFVEPRRPVPGAPPEPDFGGQDDTETIAAVGLVVGMALLEVVLLAGPAFAVGAKRARRQLALLAATGGDARDVRRTVLGGGLVLGLVGAAVGVAGGLALAAAGLVALERVPDLARFNGDVPGPFEVRPLEVLGIAAIGVGTALLAALLPARSASRQDVVAALTGRRGTVRSGAGLPVLGVLAAVAGAAIALEGARRREVLVILAGSALAELGLVAVTPALVGAAGRLGPLLPVAGRLALRDAARNRGRTAPAVSAILAAVAGAVAIGTFVASLDADERQSYVAAAAPGSAVVGLYGDAVDMLPAVLPVLERELPAAEVVVARAVGGSEGSVDGSWLEVVLPGEPDCRTDASGAGSPGPCYRQLPPTYLGGLQVGDGRLVHALTGARGPELARTLDEGGVVVPAGYLADDGTATVVVHGPDDDGTGGREVALSAAALPADAYQAIVLSEGAAASLGQLVAPVGLVVRTSELPTVQQEDRVKAAMVALAGDETSVYVERGYASDYGITVLALAVGSALLVLGASGIATGLAAADGRADLATLASVGATPGMRRRLAGAQSLVIAALGTALGVVAGLVPAVGFIRALNSPPDGVPRAVPFPLVVPWELLLVTGLVVPLLAALAAVLLTRSRLPLVRRLA